MYEFSLGTFFIGTLILAAGTLVVLFHRPIANNLAYGLSSYEKVRLWGLIGCGVGLIVMANLHTALARALLSAIGIG